MKLTSPENPSPEHAAEAADIDPRYLVPVSCLPFLPAGAAVAYRCSVCGAAWRLHSCAHYDDYGLNVVTCLDLSPPARTASGLPLWLDPLEWALGVLGWRLKIKLLTYADHQIHPREGTGEWCAWAWGRGCPPYRVTVATFTEVMPTGDGETDRRAVVAVALCRLTTSKGETP